MAITSGNYLLLLFEDAFICPDFTFKMYQIDYINIDSEVFPTPQFSALISLSPSSFLSVSLSFLFFPFFVVKGEIFYTNETNCIISKSSFSKNTSLRCSIGTRKCSVWWFLQNNKNIPSAYNLSAKKIASVKQYEFKECHTAA